MNGQVKIGHEFFTKIKADYADWRWSLVREFLQNCFDAPGCKNVSVDVRADGDATTLIVTNDGAPMDRDTLVNKLLTLGGSGKNFDGDNTGGFGVAKSLLYYCHRGYTIATGELTVRGAGAQYAITEGEADTRGTTSVITIDGDEAEDILQNVKRFAHFAQWRGVLTVNGEVLATDLKKGARRRDLGWGVVYTNNSFTNTCVVRLNGQPMFSRFTRFKGCVLVELTGKASETLTSNRDALRGRLDSQLSDLLTQLAVDKRSALREQRAEYKRYRGELMRNEASKPKEADQGLANIVDVAKIAALVATGECGGGKRMEAVPETAQGGGIRLVVESREDEPDATISVGPQFILKNATGMKTPVHYVPGEKFSRYSRDLVRSWTAVLMKLHQLLNKSGEFSVGFVFDGESVAEYERSSAYGPVYYINPVNVVEADGKRRMEARYEGAWQDRFDIISSACHEVVHGAYDLGDHDEDYASQLTEVLAVAMRHADELTDLCRPVPESKPDDHAPAAVNFRERRIDCMGHASTSVVKWMARQGWTFPCIRDSLAALGVALAENSIRSCIQDAKRPVQRGTKIAELTDAQVEKLTKLHNLYA